VRKPSEPQIVEVEPEINTDGVSVMDARKYSHYCPERVRLEDDFRKAKQRPTR
jgi:hypothetical protein